MVNGLFYGQLPRRRSVIFSVIPWGTGGDLARSVKAPARLRDALWTAATGMTLPADVGHARFVDHRGEAAERVFLNVAGFGANGEVVSRANRSSKRLGGGVTFLAATLATLSSYRPAEVELRWRGEGGEGAWRGDLLSAFVANAYYCGGGMYVGKGGSMHDGRFDLSVLPPLNPARAAAGAPPLRRAAPTEPGRGARRRRGDRGEGRRPGGGGPAGHRWRAAGAPARVVPCPPPHPPGQRGVAALPAPRRRNTRVEARRDETLIMGVSLL